MGEQEKKQLETQLWNIADELRGKMDADQFRDYILGFIFYKYLSEKMENVANKQLEHDNITYVDIISYSKKEREGLISSVEKFTKEELGYFLLPEELFSQLLQRGNNANKNAQSQFILDDLTTILSNIDKTARGSESEEDFIHLFEDLDLTSTKLGKTPDDRNTLIIKILSHLNNVYFDFQNHERDILGDAYEYLIAQFAASAGKKAGEFYTPQEVSRILAKIVTTGKEKLKSVYDPTCGSGSLLLRVRKEVSSVSNFYGQELNRTTYNLARMNMIIHDVSYRDFDIKQEDTLARPQHRDKKFEAIVANPPFSAKWSANQLLKKDERFSAYGVLAPSSKADFAFVQHMIYHLEENGTMAVVLPHGVLFRGASEGKIRQYLIEKKNYLDAVIGLPTNIFYGTSIATCILVFKKCREHDDTILFIDASNRYEKKKNQNTLNNEHIDTIIQTYAKRREIEKYSYCASIDEIKENDYNLNIPRYVDTFEEEEPVDLDAVAKEIKGIEKELQETDKTIEACCKDLDIAMP